MTRTTKVIAIKKNHIRFDITLLIDRVITMLALKVRGEDMKQSRKIQKISAIWQR